MRSNAQTGKGGLLPELRALGEEFTMREGERVMIMTKGWARGCRQGWRVLLVLACVVLFSARAWAGYTQNGNGTVTDHVTGLMWQQGGSYMRLSWEEAITYCQGLSLAGFDDWHLPDAMELGSTIDYSRQRPTIDTAAFPSTGAEYRYWSSTYDAYDAYGAAWSVYYAYAEDSSSNVELYKNYARCVRSGAVGWPLDHLVGVQGTITDRSGLPLAGVAVVTDSGDSTVSDDQGHYALTLEPGLATLTFSLSEVYQPSTTSTTVVAGQAETLDVTLLEDLGAIVAPSGIVEEGKILTSNPINFTFAFTNAQTSPIEVSYATTDGTAKAGEDYIAKSGTLTFAPGKTKKTVSVQVVGDDVMEPDEQFTITWSIVGSTFSSTATGTILTDDLPAINASSASTLEGGSGDTSQLSFRVVLNPPVTFPVTVGYATKDDTAKAGTDYTTTAGTLTFAPGESQKTVAVPVIGNSYKEAYKTLWLVLANPGNATLGRATARGKIRNDDQLPLLTITVPAPFREGDAARKRAVFVGKLSSPMATAVSVGYATKDGTATAGADYTATTGTVTFPPGQTTAKIEVPIVDDPAWEETENFRLHLDKPANLIIAATATDTTATITSTDPFRLLDVKSGVWKGYGVSFTISNGTITNASGKVSVEGDCGDAFYGSDNFENIGQQAAGGGFNYSGSATNNSMYGYYGWSWSISVSFISPTKAEVTTHGGWRAGYYDGSWSCSSSGGVSGVIIP
jgi:hypothetical protein